MRDFASISKVPVVLSHQLIGAFHKNFSLLWKTGSGIHVFFAPFLQIVGIAIVMAGCGAMHVMPAPEQPTAIQQFLMAQAVEGSLRGDYVMPVSLTLGDTVVLDASTLTVEQRFFKGALGGWLGEKGLNVVTDSDDAKYRAIVLVQSLGTEQSTSFFGMPPIESVLLPFALPEISIFKAQYQTGYTRFRMDFFENKSGKFIRSTPWFQGSTYFNEYTILFFFDFQITDLIAPL